MAKDTTADATYTPQFFMPDVYSVQNYYAFGQSMPNWSSTAAVNDPKKYRFGYNGHEKDNEIAGGGNHIAFGDYGYDTRTGRRWNSDPLVDEFPSISPYSVFGNNPLVYVDNDGKKIVVYYNKVAYEYTPGVEPAAGSPDVLFKVHEAAKYAMQTKTGKALWTTVGNSDKEVGILFKDASYADTDEDGNFNTNRFVSKIDAHDKNIGTIEWDYNTPLKVFGGENTEDGGSRISGYLSPSTALLHELGHAYLMINALTDGYESEKWYKYLETTIEPDDQYDNKDERTVIEKFERRYINDINAIEGEKGSFQRLRFNHKVNMKPTDNSADVNKAPSKQQQQEETGVKY